MTTHVQASLRFIEDRVGKGAVVVGVEGKISRRMHFVGVGVDEVVEVVDASACTDHCVR